jgi:uncharacterized small protein (DUF1192 family)
MKDVLDTNPVPADDQPVGDQPTLSDADVTDIIDAVTPATPADTPKPVDPLDKDWEDLAKVFKADKATVQKEAVDTFKKLTSPDAAVREAALADLAKAVGTQISSTSAQPTGNVDNSEIAALRSEIAQLKAQTQLEAQAKLAAEITSFAKKHPDFDSVRPDVAKVLKAGLATDLADAYAKVKAMKGESIAKPVHIKPSGSAVVQKEQPKSFITEDFSSLRKALTDSLKG